MGALARTPLSVNDICVRVLLYAAIHAATYLSSSWSRKRSGGQYATARQLYQCPRTTICCYMSSVLILLYMCVRIGTPKPC